MENKINIAELLKDCPSGMELDCTLYEDVYFDYVNEFNIIHCYIQCENYKTSLTFNQYGTSNSNIKKSKYVIFPKGKTTWEGFQRPFKDGDIIYCDYFDDDICIFKGEGNIKGTVDYYCGIIDGSDELLIKDVKDQDEYFGYIKDYKLATEEEKQKLFNAIKANGYKWNSETKTLEKLVEPKFKVDDKIKLKGGDEFGIITQVTDCFFTIKCRNNTHCWPIKKQDDWELVPDIKPKFKVGDIIQDEDGYKVKITEVNIEDECYGYESMIAKGIGSISLSEQDNWELVPNKFDITTLKPFDKVLVRQDVYGKWGIHFFGFYNYDEGYYYTTGNWMYKQCIPYEGNEYLLDTNNDCNEYFKNW